MSLAAPADVAAWCRLATQCAHEAGQLLMQHFHGVQSGAHAVAQKGDASNVVTAADLASERLIVDRIRRAHPGNNVIAEETGVDLRGSDITWVIDPLDGTSNFAAGLPWFGVLVAVLRHGVPVVGVMNLPALGELHQATAGGGATLNGRPVRVTAEPRLDNVLWAFGMDGGTTDAEAQRNVALLGPLLRRVRNVRATNCLVDDACIADGRLGGMLNLSTRLWDIAAPMLVVQEAGGRFTQVDGRPLVLDIGPQAAEREYAVLAGAPALHAEVAAMVRQVGMVGVVDRVGGSVAGGAMSRGAGVA